MTSFVGGLPIEQDLHVRIGSAGTYATIAVAFYQADGVTLVQLADATVTLAIANDDGVYLTKSTADGSLALDTSASSATWIPTAAETSMVRPGRLDRYVYDVLFPNGSSGPYLEGYLVGDEGGGDPNVSAGVVKILVPGPPGPPGANGSVIAKTPAGTISGHKVAKANGDGTVSLASSDDPASLGTVLGVTLGAASAPAQVQIGLQDEIFEPTWAWRPGPVFLGLAGALTQMPPLAGVLQQIGVSTSPTSILVDIQSPTMRA